MTTAPAHPTPAVADLPDEVEVLIVGAGISGIGAAYRLQEANPGIDYVILEGRAASGGTWDLFRYPGVRSDSDMYTLSFPFAPWTRKQAIADGDEIVAYLRETARDAGIDARIRYGCTVTEAEWSTPDQRWTVTVERSDGSAATIRAGYVHLGAGYYDYASPHDAGFLGTEDFAGTLIHPQFWPEDLDHAGKRVVVIGSGATAVSTVPAIAQTAASTTMLQRTPSYVFQLPGEDRVVQGLRKALPAKAVHHIARAKNIGMQSFLYRLSRLRPEAAKAIVMGDLHRRLDRRVIKEHFTPPYNVWDQRLCAVRSGDLFAAIRSGRAQVVTGHIDRFVREGVRLTDGRVLEADIIVTATGLRLKALGGIDFRVDGAEVSLPKAFAYRGLMIAGVPNVSMSVGYTNASWTLRSDLVSKFVASMIRHMREHGYGIAVPVAPEGMTPGPILDLTAGYVQRSISAFPKVGDRAPWTMPQSYVKDKIAFGRADVTQDMHFVPKGAGPVTLPRSAQAPESLDLPGTSSNADGSLGDQVVEVPA